MSKYSALELKAMATIVLADHEKKGDRAFLTILNLSMQTALTPTEVLAKIRSYAE